MLQQSKEETADCNHWQSSVFQYKYLKKNTVLFHSMPFFYSAEARKEKLWFPVTTITGQSVQEHKMCQILIRSFARFSMFLDDFLIPKNLKKNAKELNNEIGVFSVHYIDTDTSLKKRDAVKVYELSSFVREGR